MSDKIASNIPHYHKLKRINHGGVLGWVRMDGLSWDDHTGYGCINDAWAGSDCGYGYFYCGY